MLGSLNTTIRSKYGESDRSEVDTMEENETNTISMNQITKVHKNFRISTQRLRIYKEIDK